MTTIHAGLHRVSCRTCNASIMWATTSGGNRIPINLAPNPDGNVLVEEHGGQLYAEVLRPNQLAGARADGRDLYTNHFVDCPQADKWRTRNRRRPRR